jgi:hypothetical protein
VARHNYQFEKRQREAAKKKKKAEKLQKKLERKQTGGSDIPPPVDMDDGPAVTP